MDPETEKIIKKQIEKLPLEIRSLIANHVLENKISNIGKRNGLSEEQIGTLQVETNLIILGLVPTDEYQNELKDHLKIDSLKLDTVIADMGKEILDGIQEKLNEIYNKLDEDDIKEIKENMKNKNQSWNQNVNFVLSGGDYSAFAEENSPLEEYPRSGGGGQNSSTPSLQATPQEGNQILGTTRKIEDMKSRFTI